MTRVAVVTTEPLGSAMAGPAIRAWEMAGVLAADGHRVVLATTAPAAPAAAGGWLPVHPAAEVVRVDAAALLAVAGRSDVLVLGGDALARTPGLIGTDACLVVDAYDPFHLELLEQARAHGPAGRRAYVGNALRVLNTELAVADLVLCAPGRQHDLWVGHLAALGRVNPVSYDADPRLGGLLVDVGFGVPAAAPVRSGPGLRAALPGVGPDDRVLLWGGGLYDWFDPVTLVRAVGALTDRHPSVRLVLLAGAHPNPQVAPPGAAVRARQAAREAGLLDRTVFFVDSWVPYAERAGWLLDADAGVSTHHDHLETAYSYRTRLLDYLWAGLPVVATGGDEVADRIARAGAGLTVPPGDVTALTGALERVVAEPGWAAAAGARAAGLATELTWPRVLEPLREFCAAPRRAPDLDRRRRLIGVDWPVAVVPGMPLRARVRRRLTRVVGAGLPQLRGVGTRAGADRGEDGGDAQGSGTRSAGAHRGGGRG